MTLAGAAAVSGTGNGIANVLRGKGGADVVAGGGGSDDIYGGPGKDQLSGGRGRDDFHFDAALNASTNVDVIADFRSADDSFHFDMSVFSGIAAAGALAASAFRLGTAAADASDRIVYDSASGNIYYDADGNGAGAQLLFAQVTAGTALTSADFIAVAAATSMQARSADKDVAAEWQTSAMLSSETESIMLGGEFAELAPRILDQQQWSQMSQAPGRLDWSSIDYFSA